ncbi:hypothetical protein K2X40_01080 [Candidatus Babeliales bacterium]|nr:hypothetical protein [Candidatus Babeliales bacterium]
MKKIVSALVLSLMASQVSAQTLDKAMQTNIAQCVALAQQGMSNEEVLNIVHQALEQAAHTDSFDIEVKTQDNKNKILFIVGGVIVVAVAVGGGIYWWKSKKAAEKSAKNQEDKIIDSAADLLINLSEIKDPEVILNIVAAVMETFAHEMESIGSGEKDLPENLKEARERFREGVKHIHEVLGELRNGKVTHKDIFEKISKLEMLPEEIQDGLAVLGEEKLMKAVKDGLTQVNLEEIPLKDLSNVKKMKAQFKLNENSDSDSESFASMN